MFVYCLYTVVVCSRSCESSYGPGMAVGLLEGYGEASFGFSGVAHSGCLIILEEARSGGGNGLFGVQVISSALCHLIRSSVHC